MKYAALFLAVCLNFNTPCLRAQNASSKVSKTFAKTFQLANNENEFVFERTDSVQVIPTDNLQQVRLMLFIDAYNISNEMMKSLAESGRYLIKTQSVGAQLYVSLPFIKNNIVLNGQAIKEHYCFVLYAPKNATVSRTNPNNKIGDAHAINQ